MTSLIIEQGHQVRGILACLWGGGKEAEATKRVMKESREALMGLRLGCGRRETQRQAPSDEVEVIRADVALGWKCALGKGACRVTCFQHVLKCAACLLAVSQHRNNKDKKRLIFF